MIELYITPAALAVAVYSDLRTGRIPNWLTVGLAASGLLLQGIAGGVAGLLAGFEGLGLGLVLFLVPFLNGWMGGGDVKLMGAIGTWLGPGQTLYAALYSAVAGGVLAVAVLMWTVASRKWAGGKDPEASREPSPWGQTYPYALAIAAGTCFALWNPVGL